MTCLAPTLPILLEHASLPQSKATHPKSLNQKGVGHKPMTTEHISITSSVQNKMPVISHYGYSTQNNAIMCMAGHKLVGHQDAMLPQQFIAKESSLYTLVG